MKNEKPIVPKDLKPPENVTIKEHGTMLPIVMGISLGALVIIWFLIMLKL